MNRIGHPDWVKLCIELNCAPNQNTFCYKHLNEEIFKITTIFFKRNLIFIFCSIFKVTMIKYVIIDVTKMEINSTNFIIYSDKDNIQV